VGSFYAFLDIQHLLYVEVISVILAIKYAQLRGFKKPWLERDSFFIYHPFGLGYIIPWTFKGRWHQCLKICATIDFRVTRVFRVCNS